MSVLWWYQTLEDEQQGPVGVDELRRLLKSNEIHLNTLVWCDGRENWTELSEVNALKGLLRRKSKTPKKRASSKKNGWVERRTSDGLRYYYDEYSEMARYEILSGGNTPKKKEEELVWVRDPKEAWVLGKRVNGNVEVDGKRVSKSDETEWTCSFDISNKTQEDLVLLEDLNEATMIYNVKERYKSDDIYTWVGASQTVLVAVNPFKRLPIYGIEAMLNFKSTSPNKLLSPHPFAVANGAYLRLRVENEDQAMLISGESGSGKTETTKQVLSFLAEIAGSENAVEQRLLSANPVLEAFGNAKTIRNNNSSRFGRWMEIHFCERGSIYSARIENYLLEKSRVVTQAQHERGYHIMYQLLSEDPKINASKCTYLKGSNCYEATGVDDKQDFRDVKRALDALGFDKNTEQESLFKLAKGALRLGDVVQASSSNSFNEREKKRRNSFSIDIKASVVKSVADLLGVEDPAKLVEALTHTAIEVRGAKTLTPCSPEQSKAGAAALAKAIFGRLFDWLVSRINKAVVTNNDDERNNNQKKKFIGVLDVFGFEVFEKNSFEQLCINYTNEKLQQHFCRHTFKEEEALYVREGIDFEPVMFIDNQLVLDLLEKKPDGILLLLDDEVTAPKGNDAKWLSRCESAHANKNDKWIDQSEKVKISSSSSVSKKNTMDYFTLRHYAGNVTYENKDLCFKNKDPLGRNLYDLMALEASEFSRLHLFPPLGAHPRRQPTIAGQFRKQLTTLMKIIDAAMPCYVRCVKPNDLKKAGSFDAKSCVEQLTFSGVFEAVKIRQSGYPFRLEHKRFAARYGVFLDYEEDDSNDLRERCELILKKAFNDEETVSLKIGETMVLYRAREHRILELMRNLALERLVPVAQRAARLGLGRVYRGLLKKVRKDLSDVLKSSQSDALALDEAIAEALAILGPRQCLFSYLPPELALAKTRRFVLQERLDLDVVMQRLLADDERTYENLADCVRRADAISEIPGTPSQMDLELRVREALARVAASKIDPLAKAALEVLDKPLMETVRDEAQRARYESAEVKEILELLELNDEDLTKRQLKKANDLGDPDRVINREIKLKQLTLDTYASLFQWTSFNAIRDPREWAARHKLKSFFSSTKKKRQKTADAMLLHQSTPIHLALTDPNRILADSSSVNNSYSKNNNLSTSAKHYDKNATIIFKCILGFLGETKHPYPEQLATEALSLALKEPELRIELYAQLLKQLTKNSSSSDQAFSLLAAALASFPPPLAFENHVALFIKTNAGLKRRALTAALYAAVYGGQRTNPIAPHELYHIIKQTLDSNTIAPRYLDEDTVSSPVPSQNSATSFW